MPNTAARSVLCYSATYGPGYPFAASLSYVLSELLSATPACVGHDFYDISQYPAADCEICLASAAGQMNATCGHSVGARAVLVDCSVRYEQYALAD